MSHNNGYMPPTEDGGDIVPSAMVDSVGTVITPSTTVAAGSNSYSEFSNGVHNSNSSMMMMTVALQNQDSIIDQLSVGLGRLRDQSQAIGDEAGLQTQLLNDMENNMDNAHEVLGVEARRAAQLREDGSIWKLQLIIAGLFISFVLLILLGHM
jgi:hypothetical protein